MAPASPTTRTTCPALAPALRRVARHRRADLRAIPGRRPERDQRAAGRTRRGHPRPRPARPTWARASAGGRRARVRASLPACSAPPPSRSSASSAPTRIPPRSASTVRRPRATVDSSTSSPGGWRWPTRSPAPRATTGSSPRPTGCCRTARRPAAPAAVRLAGLALSLRLVAAGVRGPWLRDMERSGLTRPELSGAAGRLSRRRRAGRLLAGRARAAGGARRSRRPRPARSRSAPLGGLRAWRRAARPPRRRARTRAGCRRARGAGAATRAPLRAGRLLDRRDQGGGRAGARRIRDLRPRAPRPRLRRRPRPAAADHEPLQPARPAAGQVEKALAPCSRGSASAHGRSRRSTCSGSSSGRCWWGRRSPFASARCSATRAPTWLVPWPGSRC